MSRKPAQPLPSRTRRASAAVAMVIVLVVLQLALVGAIAGNRGGGGHDLTRSRIDAARAFYAAEAGMNMSIREVMLAADLDGDGGVGSISDDGVDSTDPHLGDGARVRVGRVETGGGLVLTSRARAGAAHRAIRASVE